VPLEQLGHDRPPRGHGSGRGEAEPARSRTQPREVRLQQEGLTGVGPDGLEDPVRVEEAAVEGGDASLARGDEAAVEVDDGLPCRPAHKRTPPAAKNAFALSRHSSYSRSASESTTMP